VRRVTGGSLAGWKKCANSLNSAVLNCTPPTVGPQWSFGAMAKVLRVLLGVWAQSPSTATHCGWRVAEVGHVLVLDARGRRDLRWEPTQPILGLCAEYSEYIGRASAIEH
jgi:hypothetical protein